MPTNPDTGSSKAIASARPPQPPASEVAAGEPASKRALRSQGKETMRRLLDAAMEAIDERGYHSTRVKDVVDLANTSHGTFYLYFSNKEDLVRALTIRATAEASPLYGAVSDAGSALDIADWNSLRRWIGDYSSLWSRYAPLFRTWIDLAAVDRAVVDQTRAMITAHIDAMAARITSSGTKSDIDPAVAGLAVISMLDRFHLMSEFMGTEVDEAALDTLTTMVHRALFPGDDGTRA